MGGVMGERRRRLVKRPVTARPFDERHPCIAAACFFALWLVALVVVVSAANPALIGLLSGAALRFALEAETLVAAVVATAGCALLLRRSRWARRGSDGGAVRLTGSIRSVRSVIVRFFVGTLAGAALAAVALGAFAAVGALQVDEPARIEALAMWVAACFVNAAFQELLIHGYAFTTLLRAKGLAFATVATTVLFVVLHPSAFACGPVAVAVIVGFGVLLALVRVGAGGLAGAMGLHGAWNALGGIGFGLVVLADDYPHVFNSAIQASDFVSGGAMGLEGSVVTLALVAIAIGTLLAKRRGVQSNCER